MKTTFKDDYKERGWHNFEENLTQPRHCWYPFKEGFSNQLVAEAIRQNSQNRKKPLCVLDPFCGSGTTPLSSALLGHDAIAVEVNPFSAFTTRVKCIRGSWQADEFNTLAGEIIDTAAKQDLISPLEGTSSFTEGNDNEKWLFNLPVLRAFQSLWSVVEKKGDVYTKPFKLAAIRAAMDCCNAKKDGKCLRYLKDWRRLDYNQESFLRAFRAITVGMLRDVEIAPIQKARTVQIITGDARKRLSKIESKSCNLLVTSPPYLNSFDYSDVYRPELFLGGFVESNDELRTVRLKTVRSHVQVDWGGETTVDNPMVEAAVSALGRKRNLWSKKLPAMVGAYFYDMQLVLTEAARILKPGAEAWIVVSTSAYKAVHIPVDLILADLACAQGFSLRGLYTLRPLRAAGQQQKAFRRKGLPLRESLIILKR